MLCVSSDGDTVAMGIGDCTAAVKSGLPVATLLKVKDMSIKLVNQGHFALNLN